MSTVSKAIIEELITNISTGNSAYYAFASNPVPITGNAISETYDDYTVNFISDWQMLFGKKITNNDIIPVILDFPYVANIVYSYYDNHNPYLEASNFYVRTSPIVGGGYNIYKCIDNSNGTPSLYAPAQIQQNAFTTADGYVWRYITTISSESYLKFAASGYIPIYPNTAISSVAYQNSGIDKVVIVNGGNGYSVSYNTGTIQSIVNTTLVQISSNASSLDTYSMSSIYITGSYAAELKTISSYVSNISGNWVYLNSPLNPNNVTTTSSYIISPSVVFTSDADAAPLAYSVVNTISSSISNIIMVDGGFGMTWANVNIVTNQTSIKPAQAYAIIPPAGGHGADPETELYVQGFGLSFSFANTESSNVITTTNYNKIGIIKNPYSINATSYGNSGILFTANAFNQVLQANITPSTLYTVGSQVTGLTSNALGTVVFSNSTVLYLTGDKYFSNGEYITDGNNASQIAINNRASVYTKGIKPLYIQNINNVVRSNTQTESYKLIIQA